MSHPHARLTPKARLDLVLEVEAGWTRAEAARRFRASRATAGKWVRCYRGEGKADLGVRVERVLTGGSRRYAALWDSCRRGQPLQRPPQFRAAQAARLARVARLGPRRARRRGAVVRY